MQNNVREMTDDRLLKTLRGAFLIESQTVDDEQDVKDRCFDEFMPAADELTSRLSALRAARDEAESLLASATDLLNTQARQAGVMEARTPKAIKEVIRRLWDHAAKERLNYLALKAEAVVMRELCEAVDRTPIAYCPPIIMESRDSYRAMKGEKDG